MAGRFNTRTAVARPGQPQNGRIGGMMAAAAVVSIIAIIIVLIAFATPVWLEADRNMVSNPVPPFNIPFDKMGLWQFCFRLYQIGDPFLRYSIICRWYFSSGWPPMMEFLAPCEYMIVSRNLHQFPKKNGDGEKCAENEIHASNLLQDFSFSF